MEATTTLRIFLVDDDPFCLKITNLFLSNLGYSQVETFSESAAFLDKLLLNPDVIFLDFHMDNLNGLEMLKKIKRFNPNIFVIFVSSQENVDVAVNALKYGAFDYIVKASLDEEKIKVVMDKIIKIREMLTAKKNRSKIKQIFSSLGVFSVVLFFQKLLYK